MNGTPVKPWLADVLAGLGAAALGTLLLISPLGIEFVQRSYDLLYYGRPIAARDEAVILYLDEPSYEMLNQELNRPWDRALHARLLKRLAADQTKAVVFDILFTDPAADGNDAADQAMKEAIEENGGVILGADYTVREHMGSVPVAQLTKPWEPFLAAARDWGIVQLPHDSDHVIRRQFAPSEELQTLAWAAAKAAGAEVTRRNPRPASGFYLNYYGPAGTIPAVSYHQGLYEDGVPPGFFKDKIVFVGQRLSTAMPGALKDEFGTAYTWLTRSFSPGVEIHATAFLNLLHNEWLARFPRLLEIAFVILAGLGVGYGLSSVRPWIATGLAALGLLLVTLIAWALFRFGLVWFAWLILIVQIAASLFWSVIHNSLRLYVEKRLLQQSLEFHLSPRRVKQLLDNPDLLKPGGKEQEVSILFSDIADFSEHSRTYQPEDLFNLLNQYYEAALKGVHNHEGTVVQLIGDAIFAVWNAPMPQPDHKSRVCLAAVDLQQQLVVFDEKRRGLPIRTRVGVHSGPATVGNLGSGKHFNYASIGESVNLASRLEGLNKHLKTNILATRASQSASEKQLLHRIVGWFTFKGFGDPVQVHELMGPLSNRQLLESTAAWRAAFDEALTEFCRGRLTRAAEKFQQTIQLRQEAERGSVPEGEKPLDDGPSLFYLAKIEQLKQGPLPEGWKGLIEMKEK